MVVSPLDVIFAALADPVRRAVLGQLRHGEASVTQLARPFAMSLTGMKKHVAVLARAELVQTRKRGRTRMVAMRREPLAPAREYLEGNLLGWATPPFDPAAAFIDLDNIDVT